MRILTVDDIRQLLHKVTLKKFFGQLMLRLEQDFARWPQYEKIPRLTTSFPALPGVIELMPIADGEYYAVTLVNGHPHNFKFGKRSVVGLGTLVDVKTGYPVLLSEMTLLTAIRTAATAALASKYLAVKNSKTFGMVGTGAQSAFYVLAHYFSLGMDTVYYFDREVAAMDQFAKHLSVFPIQLHRCADAQAVVEQSAVVTTREASVVENKWVRIGTHLNVIRGGAVAKTELDPELLKRSKVAELWELIGGSKPGREGSQEVTLFDSVGFALEDYSLLRLVYQWAESLHIGHVLDMIPEQGDVKDLYTLV